MSLHSFLVVLVILLEVLAISTSVFQRLRLGSVIGMLVAGIALGPSQTIRLEEDRPP